MLGSPLLAAALWRGRVAPPWAALSLPLGLIGSVAAQSAGSRPTLIGAALVLLVGLSRIALEPLQRATTAVAAGAA